MQRIDLAGAAEERDVDAAHVVLVDQHRDVAAALERAGERHRRAEARGHHLAHDALAQRDHRIGHRAEVGPAIEHRGFEPVARRDHRRQFPVGEVGGEHHRGLAVVPTSRKRSMLSGV